MFNARLSGMTDYPFTRLAGLLKDVPTPAGRPTLNLAVGEPQGAPPAMVAEILAGRAVDWGKYPPIAGTPEFRAAAAGWLERRYHLPGGAVDPDRAILPVQGTREALFQIATVASADRPGRDIVLAPNPSYATYAAAGRLAGAEVLPLSCRRENGFLPAIDRLSPDILARTSLLYLCTPSNPEGAVADLGFLKRAVTLARTHGFMLAVDECYAEIWDEAPPPGTLEAAAALGPAANGDPFANIIVFHSLSKRSSAAGLRSGFVAGDRAAIALMQRLRAYASSAPPLPILAASAALWSEETHVEAGRSAYRRKIDLAEGALAGRAGFYRPAGGFFLWLEVGDGPEAARRLWRDAGIRVLPGAYMARDDDTGSNPGQAFIRLALVHDDPILEPALRRIAELI
ncbi:MAG TPA: aminotransferase class I/II-fold pyridoxal phosphate-dependent enzyme [Alphaproteobacteria bacterium]|nr:aminotransferase class I/II-fold pyridoxal phosphate-dependent enzyme [Alphaproteobacteria bacterium]